MGPVPFNVGRRVPLVTLNVGPKLTVIPGPSDFYSGPLHLVWLYGIRFTCNGLYDLLEKRGIKSIRKIWGFYRRLIMPILICMDNSSFNHSPEWIHRLPGKNLSPYFNNRKQFSCQKSPTARLCTDLRGYPDIHG